METIPKEDLALSNFDPADYLDGEAIAAEYLTLAARDPDPNRFIEALGNVARANERE